MDSITKEHAQFRNEDPAHRRGEAAASRWLSATGRPGDFAELYEAFAPSIRRYCYTLLGDDAEACDATHDAFVALMLRRERINSGRPIFPYLRAIARNKCRDRYRRAARTDVVPELPDTYLRADTEASHYSELESRSRADVVKAVVNDLPVHYGRVLDERYYRHMSFEEIAASNGLTIGAVAMRLIRARAAARDRLRKQGVTSSAF